MNTKRDYFSTTRKKPKYTRNELSAPKTIIISASVCTDKNTAANALGCCHARIALAVPANLLFPIDKYHDNFKIPPEL